MNTVFFLILFPLAVALALLVCKADGLRKAIVLSAAAACRHCHLFGCHHIFIGEAAFNISGAWSTI